MRRMPGNPKRSREAWVELSRGAGEKFAKLIRQVKIKPEHVALQIERNAR